LNEILKPIQPKIEQKVEQEDKPIIEDEKETNEFLDAATLPKVPPLLASLFEMLKK
jgi:hypothetical protein